MSIKWNVCSILSNGYFEKKSLDLLYKVHLPHRETCNSIHNFNDRSRLGCDIPSVLSIYLCNFALTHLPERTCLHVLCIMLFYWTNVWCDHLDLVCVSSLLAWMHVNRADKYWNWSLRWPHSWLSNTELDTC